MTELSYLQQVRYFRSLAHKALARYPINPEKIEFINHGENTTFKVTDENEKVFLLRIHRSNYHCKKGILEELKWLKKLDQSTSISVQTALKNLNGQFVSKVGSRSITVLNWVEGRRIRRSLSLKHVVLVADLMRELHTSKIKLKHRPNWDVSGLVGNNAFFGNIKKIPGISISEQNDLDNARKIIFKKLTAYSRLKTCKRGPIHADLHFGNFFLQESKIAPIDFDDCGTGFHMYDIAVFLTSLKALSEKRIITPKHYKELRSNFIESYNRDNILDLSDIRVIETFELARKLIMIGWLNSRKDHPEFRKALPSFARKTAKLLTKSLK